MFQSYKLIVADFLNVLKFSEWDKKTTAVGCKWCRTNCNRKIVSLNFFSVKVMHVKNLSPGKCSEGEGRGEIIVSEKNKDLSTFLTS